MGQGRLPSCNNSKSILPMSAKAITTRSGKVHGQAVPIQEENEAVDLLEKSSGRMIRQHRELKI